MFIEDKILDISRNYYQYLMSLENVVGVGLGHKRINEISTLEPCVHILVKRKVNEKNLSSNNLIPKTYMGIKTDVVETGDFSWRVLKDAIPYKFRPLEGGAGITVGNFGDGTVGCIVTKKIKERRFFYILTNSHVLVESGKTYSPGLPIIQPSYDNNGRFDRHVVARLSEFIPLIIKEKHKNHDNFVDAAIAKLNNIKDISNKIYTVGRITGVSSPVIGERVKKVGMASGKTYGKVTAIGVTLTVKGELGSVFYRDQIEAKLFNVEGDSGSVLLNDKNEAIGLLHSGTGSNYTEYAICSDMKTVLRYLNVSIYI